MSESSKRTITNGFLRPIKRQKLLKLRSAKQTIKLLSIFILEVACQLKLLTLSAHSMYRFHPISSIRSLSSSSPQACMKKLVNFMKRCTCLIEHSTAMSRVTLSERRWTWLGGRSKATSSNSRRNGETGSSVKNSLTFRLSIMYKQAFSPKPSRLHSAPGSGTERSSL